MRSFSQWGVKELLRRSGYKLDRLKATRFSLDLAEIRTPSILPPGFEAFVLQHEDAQVYQFIFRAVPAATPVGPAEPRADMQLVADGDSAR